jgi:hypothetical protein
MSIKSIIVNRFISFLNKRGMQLVETKNYQNILAYTKRVHDEQNDRRSLENNILSIVFSKDRAMQLHAFLDSYRKMVSGYGKMYILYKTSNEKHKKSYSDLIEVFKDEDFVFIEEVDFRKQLIDICEGSFAKTIGFYVDDMIFIQPVDYNKLLTVDTFSCIVSLSRGKDLVYSQVLNKKLNIPKFSKRKDGLISFKWDYSTEFSDWTYPLGVGGYFYGRDEMVVMLRSIDFTSPNTLEGNLQAYCPIYLKRFGLCLEKIACVCVHANIVQSDWSNPILGTFSVENLLKKWEDGACININKFYYKEGQVAKYQEYEFLPRRSHA